MRAFLVSIVVVVIIAIGMAYALNGIWQETAAQAYATGGARVGDPGHNLVGEKYRA